MEFEKIKAVDAERARVDNILHKMQPDHGGKITMMFSIPQELERLTKENATLRSRLAEALKVILAAQRLVNVSRNAGIQHPYPELEAALAAEEEGRK